MSAYIRNDEVYFSQKTCNTIVMYEEIKIAIEKLNRKLQSFEYVHRECS